MANRFWSEETRRAARALARKGWLDTRWRFLNVLAWGVLLLALNYPSRHNPRTGERVIFLMWLVLSSGVFTLAACGTESQSSVGFPEGLVESTQFTLALPVSRTLLLAVRTLIGIGEMSAATAILACAAWALFPAVSASTTPADFVRLCLTTVLWLALPYCVGALFSAVSAEPLSFMCAGWVFTLLVLALHQGPPAMDVISAVGAASPRVTHRFPWPQLATSAALAVTMFVTAARVVKRREY